MALILPVGLPAAHVLRAEGLDVTEVPAGTTPPAAALRIGILNLMPDKRSTELQLLRMLGAGDYLVAPALFATTAYMERIREPDYHSANTPVEHLRSYYQSFAEVRDMTFDGLIITGAPVEKEPFEDVPYWEELLEVFAWAAERGAGVFNICWAAQAALRHFHAVPKYVLSQKLFGVFEHRIEARSALLTGFGNGFRVPVSRHSEIHREDLPDDPNLRVLADSPEAGLCLLEDTALRHIYIFNHFEYDADTLKREYDRDLTAGEPIDIPKHYYPDDDAAATPAADWRTNGLQLYQNWLGMIAAAKDAAAT